MEATTTTAMIVAPRCKRCKLSGYRIRWDGLCQACEARTYLSQKTGAGRVKFAGVLAKSKGHAGFGRVK